MDAAVVYESLFGNTRAVAEAIAAGITDADPVARVMVMRVAEAKPGHVATAGLLVVGGPTHNTRMSSPRTRRSGLRSGEKARRKSHGWDVEPGAGGPGVREWLKALPAAREACWAAAFDTCLSYPVAGGAARPIARSLRRHGYRLAAAAEGFIVTGMGGPLRDGELERARSWGAALVRQAAQLRIAGR